MPFPFIKSLTGSTAEKVASSLGIRTTPDLTVSLAFTQAGLCAMAENKKFIAFHRVSINGDIIERCDVHKEEALSQARVVRGMREKPVVCEIVSSEWDDETSQEIRPLQRDGRIEDLRDTFRRVMDSNTMFMKTLASLPPHETGLNLMLR